MNILVLVKVFSREKKLTTSAYFVIQIWKFLLNESAHDERTSLTMILNRTLTITKQTNLFSIGFLWTSGKSTEIV